MKDFRKAANSELSIVVLCYQSGETIRQFFGELLKALRASGIDWELVLVGNYMAGTVDATPAVLRTLQLEDPARIRVVAEEKQGMMGWDVRSGLTASSGEFLAFIDGDGQMPAQDLIKLYNKMRAEKWDLGKTYRVRRDDGTARRIITILYNALYRLLFPGTRSRDINAKPKIFTRKVYEMLDLKSDDWFIDAEIMIKARRLKLTIGEIPTVFYRNPHRKSYIKWKAILEFIRNLAMAKTEEIRALGFTPRGRPGLWLILGSAAILRFALFLPFLLHTSLATWLANPGFTQPYYWVLSGNLLHSFSFSIASAPSFLPNTFHVPLYPLFLAGLRSISESLPWLVSAHIFLSLAVITLFWSIAHRLLGGRIAFWSSLIFALEPFSIFQSGVFYSEILFLLFFFLSLFFLLRAVEKKRKEDVLLTGLFLGLATLTRVLALYTIVFFAFALLLAYWWKRTSWKILLLHLALLAIGCGLVIAPWGLRNYKQFGSFQLSFLPAYTFYLYNAGDFLAYQTNRFSPSGREEVRQELRDEFVASVHDPKVDRLDEDVSALINHTGDLYSASRQIILSAPLRYVKFEAIFVASSVVNEGYRDVLNAFGTNAFQPSHFFSFLIKPDSLSQRMQARDLSGWDYSLLFSEIVWLLVWVTIITGFLLMIARHQWRLTSVVAFSLLMALFFNSAAGSLSSGRYHFPSVPFIIISCIISLQVLLIRGSKNLKHE